MYGGGAAFGWGGGGAAAGCGAVGGVGARLVAAGGGGGGHCGGELLHDDFGVLRHTVVVAVGGAVLGCVLGVFGGCDHGGDAHQGDVAVGAVGRGVDGADSHRLMVCSGVLRLVSVGAAAQRGLGCALAPTAHVDRAGFRGVQLLLRLVARRPVQPHGLHHPPACNDVSDRWLHTPSCGFTPRCGALAHVVGGRVRVDGDGGDVHGAVLPFRVHLRLQFAISDSGIGGTVHRVRHVALPLEGGQPAGRGRVCGVPNPQAPNHLD